MAQRAIILIDGSNFYFKLRDLRLHRLLRFNFSCFIHSLVGTSALTGATYYVGAVRTDGTKKTQQLFSDQRLSLVRSVIAPLERLSVVN